MIQRTFGKTGWKVGALGFGAWGVGGQWGAVETQTALDAMRAAYDAGVNLFDVADAYGEPPGLSEELLGQALGPVRDSVLIATKVGNFGRRDGCALTFDNPLHVELCCDASLGRMKIDTIDFYQCHIGNLKEPDVFLEGFERLVAKGKVRAWGVSTNDVEVVKAFNRDGKCAIVQLDYSILNRGAERELLPYCLENNIGTLIRGPLAKGILSGKFTPESIFDDTVRKGWNEGDQRQWFLNKLAVVEKLRGLEKPGRTLAQAALQFTITHPGATVAIPGGKSSAQALANSQAGDAVLSAEDLALIESATV